MTKFVQIHTLVSYPPSNLNRDDLGRPKTAVMGGTQRLRVSSQSLKRAWRTSDLFMQSFCDNFGIRTKEMGAYLYKALTSGVKLIDLINGNDDAKEVNPKVPEDTTKEWVEYIAGSFGKVEDVNTLKTEQIVSFYPEEILAIDEIVTKISKKDESLEEVLSLLRKEKTKDAKKRNYNNVLGLLLEKQKAVDIAMFGRMLAANPKFNTEAAVQVSHAITVNEVAVEDDYFTAVDDLNRGEENLGSAHLGETEFASGLFYTYVCVDCELLENNLGQDKELANKALRALVEAMAKVSPTGKQNSFASRAYASYMMIEKGKQQPRSLSVSYLEPVKGKSMLKSAIDALRQTNQNMEKVYGKCCEDRKDMNAYTGEGSLDEMLDFVVN
ncbi:type I-E CRISPR-associated protein Cas7/Cse4/CasC [Methanolobus sp. WCC5]|uniref:type I-E CRISPR-associated protein Cas7/Cse4/CasC n=1 Tax=Methanolobus sp. WCC5 TaxID=3125785 RepID=UPI003255AE6A